MKTITLLLALAVSPAFAGVDLVEGKTSWELHVDDGKTNPIVPGEWPTDFATCKAKIDKPGKFICVMRVKFEAVGTCTEEWKKPPVFELKLDADGFLVLPKARAKQVSDTEWITEQFAFVHGTYPDCWVAGWAEITDWNEFGNFEGPGVDEPTGRPPTP